MAAKVERMFRTCGPGRTLPTGTASIITHEDGRTELRVTPDTGKDPQRHFVDRVQVTPVQARTYEQAERQEQTGRLIGVINGIGTVELYFFRELPVTGERVTSTVAHIEVVPRMGVRRGGS